MALLSTKGLYGLMAMYELYLHQNQSQKPLGLKDISKRCNISAGYLEQLFTMLKKAKLVKSIRGAKGGYIILEKDKITIKDILTALEGEISIYKHEIDNPLFDIFFKDCDIKLNRIFNIPLSSLNEYRQLLNDRIDFTI